MTDRYIPYPLPSGSSLWDEDKYTVQSFYVPTGTYSSFEDSLQTNKSSQTNDIAQQVFDMMYVHPAKVILPCQWCGQWGIISAPCNKCGGAIR